MKISFGSLLLLSGLTAIVPIAAVAALADDSSKQTVVIELTEKNKTVKIAEEVKTPTTQETQPQQQVQPAVDLSGVDWVALARWAYGRCGEYRDLALSVGWPAHEWPNISRIMYRESRCNTGSHNKSDPTWAGSRGLMQINGSWCIPNKWNPAGYLQAQGVLQHCDELWDAKTNLRAAYVVYSYSLARHGYGWNPWKV